MISPPPPGDDPEDAPGPQYRTGWLLQRAYRNSRRRFSAALAQVQIDAPHFGVLLALDAEQPLSQTQLVQRNSSDRTAMVRTLDDLERLGYVQRRQSATDRRTNEVTLTPAGRKAFVRAQRSAVAVTQEMFGVLEEDERAELDRLLAKVIDGIESRPDE